MTAALRVELLKLRRSTVGHVGTAAIVLGTVALCGGLMAAVAAGDPELTRKLGPDATWDWSGLLASAAQVTGAGGLLAFGVVAAWLFGREFADGTVTGLFALPVGRATVAGAKLLVLLAWSVFVSVAVAVALLLLGLALGLGVPDAGAWAALGRQVALGVLSAAVALPAAWVATTARSLLGGVTCAIGLVVVAQVGVLAGAGGWLPLAAPTLWVMSAGEAVSAPQLLGVAAFAAAVGAATTAAWHRLQLDA
jgi:ABC-2 type transport system permease protein